jgi:hypothetical protein
MKILTFVSLESGFYNFCVCVLILLISRLLILKPEVTTCVENVIEILISVAGDIRCIFSELLHFFFNTICVLLL